MGEGERTRGRTERSVGRGRWWASGSIFGLPAITLLLLVAPATQGAPVHSGKPTITLTAPYPGATSNTGSSTSQSGCALAKIAKSPSFSTTTGLGGFSLRSSSTSCSSLYDDFSSTTASLQVTVPISLYSGKDTVRVNWNFDVSRGAHLGALACS